MAEILIPNMDKPKFCLESSGDEPKTVKVCPFRELCIRKWGGYIGVLNVHSEACPLVEVPTHGDWHTEPPTEDDIRGIEEENEYCFALCLFYDQWYLSNYLFKANIKEQYFETETDKGEVIKFPFSCNYPWMRIEPYKETD